MLGGPVVFLPCGRDGDVLCVLWVLVGECVRNQRHREG